MIDQVSNSKSEYDLLCEILPTTVVQASELCALPHTVDDHLGYEILQKFANSNGTTRAILSEIKQLPFVYPYEEEKWRFADGARIYFVARLEQRNGTFIELHKYLKEYFEAQRQHIRDNSAPQARELDWRIAYHLAPVSPDEAIEQLSKIGENAVRTNQVADVKGVIDLFEEQKRWLSDYQVERAYFEGRYAYAKRNYNVAENRFQLVWDQGQPDLMKAISGHLLGLIWTKRKTRQWYVKAEQIYRHSLEIRKKIVDRHGEAIVLTSLGDVLIKLGGQKRLEEAEQCYHRSLEIEQSMGNRHGEAMVLNSLGGALVKLGGQTRLEEAEQCYHRSLEIKQKLGDRRGESMGLNSLGGVLVRLGGQKRLEEAEQCYRRSLEIKQKLGDRRGEAMGLNSLGGVLVKLGGRKRLEEAEQCYRNSLIIEQSIGNRHGEAMVLTSLGGVLAKLGGRKRLEEAEQCYRHSLTIEQSTGNHHGEAMVLTSLGGVLTKLGGRTHLEEAEQCYRRSLEIKQKFGDRRGEVMALHGLANIAEAKGDIEQACRYMEKKISINKALGNQHYVNQDQKRLQELKRELNNH